MGDAGEAEEVGRCVEAVLDAIHAAEARSGRPRDAVRLIAATKSVPPDRIRAAIEAGVRILGENRLQEALPKIQAIGPRSGVAWHFIGRLQRRKVKGVVGVFELIHSVDSLELAGEVDRRAREAGLIQAVLLEVNIGGEATKGGFAPEALLDAAKALAALPNVAVRGLMTIPPPMPGAEAVRPYFRRLRELAQGVAAAEPSRVRMDELSMGMSQDFVTAVEEGATFVRVGTAIFGPRPA